MADLKEALKFVLPHEGGYGEPPGDDQPTYAGIIAADLALYHKVPVSSITVQQIKDLAHHPDVVLDIYKQQYWDLINGEHIHNQNIASAIMDTAVNRGVSVGAKYAQKTCNLLGSHLVIDGHIGPASILAINTYAQASFIRHFEALEMAGYEALIAANPARNTKYRHSWESRASDLLKLV